MITVSPDHSHSRLAVGTDQLVGGSGFTLTSATSPQLVVQVDTSNKLSVGVSVAGAITYTAAGASAGHTFANAVAIQGNLTLSAVNIVTDTTTGLQVGTVGGAAGQKLAFLGSTPIVQAVLATGTGKSVDNVLTALQNLGLIRQS